MRVEKRVKGAAPKSTIPAPAGMANGHTVDHPFIMSPVDEFLYDGGKYYCTVLELSKEGSLQGLLDQR
jgi:hypothetical protein